jgi:proline dehydrogenase
MLRSLLIYLSQADWMRRLMMSMKIARKVALRFVAGETLEQAIDVIKELNEKSMLATLDQLGEHTDTAEKAKNTTGEIIKILDAIDRSGVKSGLSIKLSQLGLLLDQDLCENNVKQILEHAQELNIFVRIDMEESACVDATLELYWKMRREFRFENVGMVLQSCLYRSKQDTADLLAGGARIRMVKGAYLEPAEIAYPKKKDTDAAFDDLTRMMLDAAKSEESPAVSEDGRWPPVTAAGTHDEARILNAIDYAESNGIPKEKLEIQMLYGIRRDLQQRLTEQGYPVRIYVPFGTEWYPYFMRRLAERPANLWFFVSSLFRK